jgi:hypothetical protein
MNVSVAASSVALCGSTEISRMQFAGSAYAYAQLARVFGYCGGQQRGQWRHDHVCFSSTVSRAIGYSRCSAQPARCHLRER